MLWAPGTASGLGGPTVAGGELVGAANAFERILDGHPVTFEPARDGLMRDVETGSTWNPDGRAVEGELAGEQLPGIVTD